MQEVVFEIIYIILHYPFIDLSCIVAGVYATYTRYDELRRLDEMVTMTTVDPGTKMSPTVYLEPVENQWNQILAMKNTWLAFMILSCIALVIVVLLVIFLRNRIRIAVALIKEASK
jgi:choline transporter-like protein 2/4/5